ATQSGSPRPHRSSVRRNRLIARRCVNCSPSPQELRRGAMYLRPTQVSAAKRTYFCYIKSDIEQKAIKRIGGVQAMRPIGRSRALTALVITVVSAAPALAAKLTDKEHTNIEEPRPPDVPDDASMEGAGAVIGKIDID